ncbi:MAG: CatB-related O-acetyltransferase [Propionivibrio sp.]
MGLLKSLDKIVRCLRGERKIPKFYRGQRKFRFRYPNYKIGLGSYGLPIVHDWSEGTLLTIGAFTSIADDVHIFLGGHHRTDWISSYPFPAFVQEAEGIKEFGGTRGNVTIGNDVWLASGCTILSGVNVGDGAVVAARAVVARSVEPYAIVAGNPARVIGWRFEPSIRDALRASCWWLWPEEEIRRMSPLLCSEKVHEFLAYVQRRDDAGTIGAKR